MLVGFDRAVEGGPMGGADPCQVMAPWNSTLPGLWHSQVQWPGASCLAKADDNDWANAYCNCQPVICKVEQHGSERNSTQWEGPTERIKSFLS